MPMEALANQKAVYLAQDLLLMGWLGWGIAEGATAAAANQVISLLATAARE